MSVNERDNPMQEPQGAGDAPMSAHEQYLWDGTGMPDVDTARMEGTLRPLRHAGELPVSIGAIGTAGPRRMKLVLAAAAAVLLLAVAGLGFWLTRPKGPEQIGPWTIAEKSGTVTVGEEGHLKDMHAGVSREVTVGSGGNLVLSTAGGGQVVFKPGVRGRIYADAQSQARWVGLSRGMVTVECGTTPIGVDIDGKWAVFEKGAVGQVMFAGNSAEVTVKSGSAAIVEPETEVRTRLLEGMVCRVDQAGPRVPLRTDAPREFSKSLRDVQMAAAKDPKAVPKAAEQVAAIARREDLATLWNLAWRLEPESRRPIIERLAQETGLMKQKFAYEAAVKGDSGAMDQLWDAVRGVQAEKTPEKTPQKAPMQK